MATHSAARRGHAKASPVRTTTLLSGAAVPVLGQGTWHMAEPRLHDQEVAALRSGLDLGLTLSATPAHIVLSWALRQEGVIAIPRASKPKHVQENRAALDVHLTQNDLFMLDQAFPPPGKKVPLEML